MTQKWVFNGLVGALLSLATFLWGGFDTAFLVLFTVMLLDIITGYMQAVYSHTLLSDYGWKGWLKKFATLFVVIAIYQLDKITPQFTTLESPFRDLAIYAMVVNEAISIIENAGQIGVPIPKFIMRYFSELKSKVDPGELDKSDHK